MRLEIELYASTKKRINLNYNYYISSAIYNLLSQHDKDFSAMLHNKGYELNGKNFKLFVFSKLMPDSYKIKDGELIINEGITKLYVNSPIRQFIDCLGHSLLKKERFRVGEEEFFIKNVFIRDAIDFEHETEFMTLSPIVVTTGEEKDGKIKARALHITEDKFIQNIKNNLIKKYFLVHGNLPHNMGIDIEFDKKYLNKENRGKLINFKGIMIKGYIAPFKMRCSEDIKKIAVYCGIGENNSIGMGYIMEKNMFVDLR